MVESGKVRRPTSVDVAREAGLSRATVSYVFNDAPHQTIPEATRQRVFDAASRLGYKPSAAARALRSGRSDIILCVLPNWPIGAAVGSAIEHMSAAFERRGLTFVAHPRAHSERPISEVWKSITPAAVISFEDFSDADTAEMLASGIDHTVVLLSRTARRRSELQSPEHQIGIAQVHHLAEAGHQRIGFAYSDDRRVKGFAEPRLDGVRRACAELNLPAPEVRVVPLDPAAAELAVRGWRSAVPPITAVCAYNDEVAMAVLAGMRVMGLAAPTDMAVIGVDDIPAAALTDPPLTTIAHDFAVIAERTAASVERALAGKRPLPRRSKAAGDDVVLVRRESV